MHADYESEKGVNNQSACSYYVPERNHWVASKNFNGKIYLYNSLFNVYLKPCLEWQKPLILITSADMLRHWRLIKIDVLPQAACYVKTVLKVHYQLLNVPVVHTFICTLAHQQKIKNVSIFTLQPNHYDSRTVQCKQCMIRFILTFEIEKNINKIVSLSL